MNDRPINVLVVEDDKALQDVYVMILSSQGFKVMAANNGVMAFNTLKDFTPDIIILDYFMPVMDGKTFLMNYDANLYPETKIVIATNTSEQNVLDEMVTLGAHSYVLKSRLSPGELVDLVQTVSTEH